MCQQLQVCCQCVKWLLRSSVSVPAASRSAVSVPGSFRGRLSVYRMVLEVHCQCDRQLRGPLSAASVLVASKSAVSVPAALRSAVSVPGIIGKPNIFKVATILQYCGNFSLTA